MDTIGTDEARDGFLALLQHVDAEFVGSLAPALAAKIKTLKQSQISDAAASSDTGTDAADLKIGPRERLVHGDQKE